MTGHLGGDPTARPVRPPVRIILMTIEKSRVPPRSERQASPPAAGTDCPADRKSVARGKSVSVRVELGRPRPMTKNDITSRQTEHTIPKYRTWTTKAEQPKSNT